MILAVGQESGGNDGMSKSKRKIKSLKKMVAQHEETLNNLLAWVERVQEAK